MMYDPITKASFAILLFAIMVVIGVELYYYYEKNILSKKTAILSMVSTLFFIVGIYTLIYNPSQNQGQNITLGFVLFVFVLVNGLVLYEEIKNKKGERMAEEKKSSGSYNLQVKIPNELKEKLEKKAENAGVSLNQYIMYMFVEEVKK